MLRILVASCSGDDVCSYFGPITPFQSYCTFYAKTTTPLKFCAKCGVFPFDIDKG